MGTKIKTIMINAKHDDRAGATFFGEGGAQLYAYDVGMPYVGILGGDYTRITIDNETGTIIGWRPVTDSELESLKS